MGRAPRRGAAAVARVPPTWLAPDEVWRLAAIVSLAMADAAEAVAGLPAGTVRLKWPNDLVSRCATSGPGGVRKLAGVLGETSGLGTADPRAVIGLGINTDWPADAFPPELAASMTSLRERAGRPRSNEATCSTPSRAPRGAHRRSAGGSLRRRGLVRPPGHDRPQVRLETRDGTQTVRATGVDPVTGALIVVDPRPRPWTGTSSSAKSPTSGSAEPVAGRV